MIVCTTQYLLYIDSKFLIFFEKLRKYHPHHIYSIYYTNSSYTKYIYTVSTIIVYYVVLLYLHHHMKKTKVNHHSSIIIKSKEPVITAIVRK